LPYALLDDGRIRLALHQPQTMKMLLLSQVDQFQSFQLQLDGLPPRTHYPHHHHAEFVTEGEAEATAVCLGLLHGDGSYAIAVEPACQLELLLEMVYKLYGVDAFVDVGYVERVV